MKTAIFAAITILAFTASAFTADSPPPIFAPQAAQIAQTDLESRGLQSTIYIAQVIYKKKSAMNSEAHWEILWNKSFAAQTKGRNEFGIRVLMDGTFKRAVK